MSLHIIPKEGFTSDNYEDFVRSRVKQLHDAPADFHHAATGMVGEAVELAWAIDQKNMLEELGDFGFYLIAAYQIFEREKMTFSPLRGYPLPTCLAETFDQLIKHSAGLLDLTKKGWIYRKPLDAALIGQHLFQIEQTFSRIHHYFNLSRSEVMYSNYRKLSIRYPDGYTDAAAQARADKPAGE